MHTPSSSDHIDGRGPLRQLFPGVSTTASSGPLGKNAKRCAVGDLLNPRVTWATYSPAPTGSAGASSYCRNLDNTWWVGVLSLSLNTWSNSEFRLLVMMSLIQGRLIVLATSVFLMKSCQRIPRIICWQHMWKVCRSVHATKPYNRMDIIQFWYKRSFICSWSRDCCHTVHRLHGSEGDANLSENIWLTLPVVSWTEYVNSATSSTDW